MIMTFQWANAVNQHKPILSQKIYHLRNYIRVWHVSVVVKNMKNTIDGFKVACVKCGHGPQNHDDEFRAAARKNESQSQKRDADFG